MRLSIESPGFTRLWIGFPILFPFYFFSSGTPQIADLYFALFFLLMLIAGFSISEDAAPPVQFLVAFAAHVCLVSAFWATWHAATGIAVFAAFYLYNTAVFVAMTVMYAATGDKFLRITIRAVAAAVVLQVMLSPITLNLEGYRQSLFFNNPNQLGYFGLLCGVVLSVGREYFGKGHLLYVGVHLCVLYLIALSLSKAALIGYFFLVAVLLMKRPVALAVLLLAGILVYPAASETIDLVANLETRLSSLGSDTDDSWAQRGYDRIWNEPGYWLAGAGEGAYRRFNSVFPNELHSSWGTLFFAYGAIGTTLFCLFLFCVARALSPREILLTVPVFLYGMTHQGLRFTMFWVLLGVLYCIGAERRRQRGDRGLLPTPAFATG